MNILHEQLRARQLSFSPFDFDRWKWQYANDIINYIVRSLYIASVRLYMLSVLSGYIYFILCYTARFHN